MSITAQIDFIDFFSQKFENTEEIYIIVKHDDINYQDKFPDSQGISLKFNFQSKDIKCVLIVSKDESFHGKGEILLLNKQFLARESLVNKWINLENFDGKKRRVNDIMKINIRISLNYFNMNSIPNNIKRVTVSKGLAMNSNLSGNINILPSTRLSLPTLSKKKQDLKINNRYDNSPQRNPIKPASIIFNLSLKNQGLKEYKKGIRRIKGKSEGHSTSLISSIVNNSVNSQINPNNLSCNNSNSRINNTSLIQVPKIKVMSNFSKSEKKTNSSQENKTNNFLNIISKSKKIENSPSIKNNIVKNNETMNLESKIESDIEDFSLFKSSFKDTFFDEENIDKNYSLFNELNCHSNKFKENYNEMFFSEMPNDLFLLNSEACLLMEELFKFQKIYYSAYRDLLLSNQKFKDSLLLYNMKYRMQIRKNYKLIELKENLNLKTMLKISINKEEKSRLRNTNNTGLNQINMLKKMFHMEFDKSELNEYKDRYNKKVSLENEEKTVLIKAFNSLFNNKELKKTLSIKNQIKINNIIRKNNLPFAYPKKILSDLDNFEKYNENDLLEKTLKEKTRYKNLREKENKESFLLNDSKKVSKYIKKAESKEFDIHDEEFDKNLKVTLINHNQNFVLRKICKGIYEYNGYKLRVIFENKLFKVRLGVNDTVELLKFLPLIPKKKEIIKNKSSFNSPTKSNVNNYFYSNSEKLPMRYKIPYLNKKP